MSLHDDDAAPAIQANTIRDLFHRLDEVGVSEYIVCAGARNAALIQVVAARCAASSKYKVARFFDERSASFYALGRVMTLRCPVAVFTTSGTAVAELLPAMVEAYYQGLPLIAITADRPMEYAGSGAPQAIEQEGIFGIYANSSEHGPLHWNIRLEEQALSDLEVQGCLEREFTTPKNVPNVLATAGSKDLSKLDEFWRDDQALVILAAGLTPEEASELAPLLAKLKAPIVTEATANLHGFQELSDQLLHGGEYALKALAPSRVIRIGVVPSWRWWRDLEDDSEVKVLNVTATPFRGLARKEKVWMTSIHSFKHYLKQHQEKVLSHQGTILNVDSKRGSCEKLENLLSRFPFSEVSWMRHLSRCIGSGSKVLLGNSLPIREWNLAAELRSLEVSYYANRGANGIDGLISTWLGVGNDSPESWLILGDLSALYDSNALWILPQLKPAIRRLVVINNSGGQIFSRVAWLRSLPSKAREMMVNPHDMRFQSWAAMWGVDYRLLENPLQLEELASKGETKEGLEIWEIRPDAAQTEQFWQEWS